MIPRTLLAATFCFVTIPAMAGSVLPDVPAPAPASGGGRTAPKPATPAAEPVKPDDPAESRLRFADGDALCGALVSFDAKTGLVWKHKDGLKPFVFHPDSLDRVSLSSFAPKKAAADVRLDFHNGDALLGKLVAFTPAVVTLDTWYAGRLSVPTDTVRSLTRVKGARDFIMAGFGRPQDWKIMNGNARQMRVGVTQTTLIDGTHIGRELELPTKYWVTLEVAGSNPQFMLGVMSDGVPLHNGNCFLIRFNDTHGVLQKVVPQGGRGSHKEDVRSFRMMPRKGNLTLSVCVDTEARTLTVVADGQVMANAIPADFKIGKHLVLGSQGGAARFARLQVEAWSGSSWFEWLKSLDGIGNAARRRDAGIPDTDIMVLNNGKDRMSGELLGIKDGKASFKTSFTTLEMPLDRTFRFDLSSKNGRAPKNAKEGGKGDVQFFFNEGERLTLALEAIKDGKITGTSASFGPCTADLCAFQKVLFNPGAPLRTEAQKGANKTPKEDQ